MNLPSQLAKHFREVCFGGNWTDVNMKDSLAGITWQQATTKIHKLNTIAALVYHINYYVRACLMVLEGKALEASDKYSFDLPPVNTQKDWDELLEQCRADAEKFASMVEQLPESKLWDDFSGNKYGNFYRNIQGIIEHTHYHLGQIVLIKKMILQ